MTEIKPDWHAVALNETRYFNILAEDQPLIENIFAVYMFNKNEHTYCCEIAPSYFLIGLYYTVDFVDDIDDDRRDELIKRYCYETVEDNYYNCSSIDRHSTILYHSPDRTYEVECPTEEKVREYWQGNCPY